MRSRKRPLSRIIIIIVVVVVVVGGSASDEVGIECAQQLVALVLHEVQGVVVHGLEVVIATPGFIGLYYGLGNAAVVGPLGHGLELRLMLLVLEAGYLAATDFLGWLKLSLHIPHLR